MRTGCLDVEDIIWMKGCLQREVLLPFFGRSDRERSVLTKQEKNMQGAEDSRNI